MSKLFCVVAVDWISFEMCDKQCKIHKYAHTQLLYRLCKFSQADTKVYIKLTFSPQEFRVAVWKLWFWNHWTERNIFFFCSLHKQKYSANKQAVKWASMNKCYLPVRNCKSHAMCVCECVCVCHVCVWSVKLMQFRVCLLALSR